MNSTNEHEAFFRRQENNWQRASRGPLILRLSATMALTFAMVASAQSYRVLKSFGVLTNVSGYNPQAPLVRGLDGVLYGTASLGEGSVAGTVFKLNSDGTGFRVLRWFTNRVEGAYPRGGLVLSGNILFGTTSEGGSSYPTNSGCGVIFKMNTDGSGYSVLKNFAGSDGQNPQGGLVLAGSTLYGTTEGGGLYSWGDGVVFKVNTDGSGYAVLKSFTGVDGGNPRAGLVLAGGALYGITESGSVSGGGAVFKVSTDGSGYAVLKGFSGTDGQNPYADRQHPSCDHVYWRNPQSGCGHEVERRWVGLRGAQELRRQRWSIPDEGLVLRGVYPFGDGRWRPVG